MADNTVRVVRATADTDASTLGLLGTVYVWGVTARNSGTGASAVVLEDRATITGSADGIVLDIAANPTGFDAATTFEEFYGVMLPAPIKCTTGVSLNLTTADVVLLYVQGGD